ncbi:hypothetical protein GCM10009796_01100 [Microbacterium koreense]
MSAVDVLQSGRSLDIEGEHGSGRTHFLARVGHYFTTLGWKVITVTGITAFARTPLVALAIAGITEAQDSRPSAIPATVRALADAVTPGRTLIVVDDWDALDEYSGGVIRAVQTQRAVPVLSSRLIHRSRQMPVLPMGAFTTTYEMRMPPMGYGELEAALEHLAGFRIEAGTLSRVFAKSGGNIGLAAAVVDAARRAGRLTVDGGVAHARGTLWSHELRLMTEVILQPLDDEAIEALEVLSLLGPVDTATAGAAIGIEQIAELEGRAFVDIIDVGGTRMVSVHPPLLVEHFRHDSLAGRRAQLLARIDDVLAAAPTIDDAPVTPRDSAMFVRLVHEQTRRRTLQAREAWRTAPSLASATDLLLALEVDGAHDPDELESLIGAAHGLDGTEREKAEWDAARGVVRAVRGGDPAGALFDLRRRAATMPREGALLLARAAELESSFLTVPDTDPVAGADGEGVSESARAAVLRARAFWMLVRGRVGDAETVLDELRASDAPQDATVDALAVFAHIVADRRTLADEIARRGLAEAQRAFDARGIRDYAYLCVLIAALDRRTLDAEHLLSESSFLGLPSPYPPLSFIGLKTLAASLAARRGHRALMEQTLADIDAEGLGDGPFPGQATGIVYARIAEIEEGTLAAAEICVQTGDELVERGALLSAAYAYLDALEYDPAPARWERVAARVEAVDAPAIARHAAFLRAVIERDVETALATLHDLERDDLLRDAAHAADLALRAWADDDDIDAHERVRTLRDRLRKDAGDSLAPVTVVLTRREREIAEMVAAGLSNAVIAEALVLSVRTVESHVNRLLRKTGLARRQDVKAYLLAHGSTA